MSLPFCAVEGFGLPLWYLESDLSPSSGLLLFLAVKSRMILCRPPVWIKQLSTGMADEGASVFLYKVSLDTVDTVLCEYMSKHFCTASCVVILSRLRCRTLDSRVKAMTMFSVCPLNVQFYAQPASKSSSLARSTANVS